MVVVDQLVEAVELDHPKEELAWKEEDVSIYKTYILVLGRHV